MKKNCKKVLDIYKKIWYNGVIVKDEVSETQQKERTLQ